MKKMFKNVNEGPISTIIGIIVAVLSLLVALNVINVEIATNLQEQIIAILGGVVSIIAIFSPDYKKAP